MNSWLLALRPKTLSAAVVPVVVGSSVAAAQPEGWQPGVSLLALLSAGFIQIATNLFNDALDHKKGVDTAERLGPVRVTQAGLLTSRQVMAGGFFCLVLALAFGIPLVIKGGLPIILIGILSLVLAYAYTGGPYPLAYRGLGDLFVFLFFGLVAVGGVVYLHLGRWPADALVAGAQTGLLGTVLIAINNFRDHSQDLLAGKRTLAARFGPRFARVQIPTLLFCAYALCLWWFWTGRAWATFLPLLSLPLAVQVARGIFYNEPSPLFNRYLGKAAGTQLAFGGLLALGLVL